MDTTFVIDVSMDLFLRSVVGAALLYVALMVLFDPLLRKRAERRYKNSPEGRASAARVEATNAWLAARAKEDQSNG